MRAVLVIHQTWPPHLHLNRRWNEKLVLSNQPSVRYFLFGMLLRYLVIKFLFSVYVGDGITVVNTSETTTYVRKKQQYLWFCHLFPSLPATPSDQVCPLILCYFGFETNKTKLHTITEHIRLFSDRFCTYSIFHYQFLFFRCLFCCSISGSRACFCYPVHMLPHFINYVHVNLALLVQYDICAQIIAQFYFYTYKI